MFSREEMIIQKLRDLRDKFLYQGYWDQTGPSTTYQGGCDDYYEIEKLIEAAFEEGIAFALGWAATDLQMIISDMELEKMK